MHATLVTCRNPFYPERDRDVVVLRRRRKIANLAPRTHLPHICLLNGEALLRADWQRTVQDGDIVTFVTLPQDGGGGGGSNPLQAVLSVALLVWNPGALLAGQFGLTGTAAGIFGGLANMAIGSVLTNALIPPPTPPTPQRAAALAAPSPTYSLNAQGNAARLGAAIPVQYGRHIAFPDFAADPYAEFVGNEQFLYQLLVIGQGDYSIEAVRLEDTPVANFEEITYEIISPGGTVSLFPANVVTSIEVSGQEALTGVYLGPFIVNASGTLANFLGIDVVCPKGLYYANDAGGLNSKSVTFTVEAQTVDANGAPVGGWTTLGTETISAATNTPQRKSYRYAVAQARYQVRLKRTDTKDTSARAGHDLNWAGLRAYLPGNQQYGNLTLIALRMKASNNLSQAASRRVNVIATRKLPIWNGTSWSANTATRSIAWAIADACRNTDYGAKRTDAQIDLAQLLALDAIWTARGDTFDGRFDNTLTFWEAVTQIARCGRAKPYQQGGIIHVVRDQAQTVPVAMFSPRNTVRGSLKIDYLMPTEETADAVIVEYFDSSKWKPDEVTSALTGSSAANPVRVKLFGCTARAQAWREGMYMAACNRYRRKPMVFSTEMEGFIPTFGDLVALSSERLTRAQTGEITVWDAGTLTLTTSEPLTWQAGQSHYFGLRRRDGSFSGPWLATAGVDEYHAVLAGAPDITPYTGGNEERTHFTFGIGTEYRQLALLRSAKARGHLVELALINDDPLVHIADTGNVPAPPAAWQLVKVPTVPAATVLHGVVGGTPYKPVLSLAWQPAPGADHYAIEKSLDGLTWTRVGDTTATHYSLDVLLGTIWMRVAGIGLGMGSWTVQQFTVSLTANPPSAPVSLSIAIAGQQYALEWGIPASAFAIEYYEVRYGATWADGAANAIKIYTTRIQQTVNWSGARTFWVAAVDIAGNVSAPSSAALTIAAPKAPTVTNQVIDNNILLYWTDAAMTLPVASYEIRKGATYATSVLIGPKSGLFTALFESVAGNFTYWVTGIDSAGNYGTPNSVTATMSQPPDFFLYTDYFSAFGGTLSSAILAQGKVVLPTNPTETFAQHFTAHSWSTPQDQINAGYPVFIEPTPLSGYYEETIDYGTALASSKIAVTPTWSTDPGGTPTVAVRISTKLNIGDAWVDHDVSLLYATNFRYVKARITVTSTTGSDPVFLSALNIRLDQKQRSDNGMATCNAGDTGGTVVNFNTQFYAVTSITVTPQGTTVLVPVYDFAGGANPTGFKILLFNSAGARVSGTASWNVKGY